MNTELINEYRKAREHKPFMLVGRDAESSLHAARVILRFRELEAQGRVRMRAEAEEESYFDVFGEPDTEKERADVCAMLDRLGCWCVFSEVWDGCGHCGRGDWEVADSVGMCAGYKNPPDPYENCYVIDMMQAAIARAEGGAS